MTLPFWWHWQNLNEDARGNAKGRFPWHGRAFLNGQGPIEGHTRRVEWKLGPAGLRAMLRMGGFDDTNLNLSFSFLVGSLYLSVGLPARHWLSRRLPKDEGRAVGFYLHGNNLHLAIWERENGWKKSDPKWWSTHLFLDDLFLGPAKYSTREFEKVDVLIPMAEGGYPATVTLLEATWKRPRWFRTTSLLGKVEIPGGIPTPGKGENSYDCGQDGLFGLSCKASTVHEAIAKTVASVLRDRERRGGRNWTPESKKKRRA